MKQAHWTLPRKARLPLAVYGILLGGPLAAQETTAAKPAFEKLLVLNSNQIFGGKLALDGERFELTFDGVGQMTRGFEGPGILDAQSKGIQGGNKKFIIKEKDIIYPNLACAGIAQPAGALSVWTSRFPVAGEVKVKFDMRLPGLVTSQSDFFARLNVEGKTYLETYFFQTAEKRGKGTLMAKKETPLKEYASHPSKWYPRAKPEGMPIELSVEGDRFRVQVGGKELVALDKVNDVSHGKIAFGFKKIVFTMQNLKISGKLDRAWCESELAQLEKAGKLLTHDPNDLPLPGEPAPAPPAPPDTSKKKDEPEK